MSSLVRNLPVFLSISYEENVFMKKNKNEFNKKLNKKIFLYFLLKKKEIRKSYLLKLMFL